MRNEIEDANEAVVRLTKFDWLKCCGSTLEEIMLIYNREPDPMRLKEMAASGAPDSSGSELPIYHFIPDVSLYFDAVEKGQIIHYHKHGLRYAM